jgi:two-component system, response regulator PdtaR
MPDKLNSVLIVEGEYLIASSLGAALSDAGWKVLGPAASVEDALHLLERERPTVATLDPILGRKPATPVAEKLTTLGVPFVLLTGHSDPHLVLGRAANGVPIFEKPVEYSRLLASLAALAAYKPSAHAS